jgi:hypothetical protein
MKHPGDGTMHAGIPHLAKKIAAAGMACAALLAMPAGAVSITVKDPNGKPLPTVMVSRQPVKAAAVDTSDNGYPASGKPQQAYVELARFTDAQGQADIPAAEHPWKIRLRKPGYQTSTCWRRTWAANPSSWQLKAILRPWRSSNRPTPGLPPSTLRMPP